MLVFVGFPEFAGTGTIERVGRRQRNAREPWAAARSICVGLYLTLMRVLSIVSYQFMGKIVTPFSEYTADSATYRYSVTGPAVATAYQESLATGTKSGETPLPAGFTQTTTAGQGDTAATVIAEYAGSAPSYSAEHLGTTPGQLETTDGLVAAMGGLAVHRGPSAVVRGCRRKGHGQLRRQRHDTAGSLLQHDAKQLDIAPLRDRLPPFCPRQQRQWQRKWQRQRRLARHSGQRPHHGQRHGQWQQRSRAGAAGQLRRGRQ